MTKRSAAGELQDFLHRLCRCLQQRNDPLEREARFSLALAGAALGDWIRWPERSHPLQIAVIGPTQAGKSTVVNLLLGAQQAEASALAAFTDRLHGFIQADGVEDYQWVGDALDKGGISLTMAAVVNHPGTIVWDTPDFDSHRSHDYQGLIADVAALADILVVVVSKEKYSDLSVWKNLEQLKPLGRRLLICLNKISSEREILLGAVRQRVRESGWPEVGVPVIDLPYVTDENAFEALRYSNQVDDLVQHTFDPSNRFGEEQRFDGMRTLIEANWENWLQPVTAEINAVRHWRGQVDQGIQAGLIAYRDRYLDHTGHYDAFNRAVLQLLELLEIPGVAAPLARIRKVLTWPVKTLLAAFKGRDGPDRALTEATLLKDIADHLLLSLQQSIASANTEPLQAALWWRQMHRVYTSEADALRRRWPSAINAYQADFAPEIERAAQSLYARLQQSPLVLNTLRATRIGADAAAVLVAVKTGTMGLSEALLTPAMLSLTSVLTEGAVGSYMETVRSELKDEQFSRVQTLFADELAAPLDGIRQKMSDAGLFRIDEDELNAMDVLKTSVLA